jgi:branched-chain amino acid transport system substrate-binding protein
MPAVMRFSRSKRWYRMAMVTVTTATGQASDLESKNALALPENRDMKIVAWESFNPSDVSVAAQVARVKSGDPQVIFTPSQGAAFSTLLRGLNDAGVRVPIITSAANEQPEQLKPVQSILPPELYLNGLLYYAADTIKRGALKTAMDQFYGAFKAAGVKPTPDSGQAWDPALIIVTALRKLGTSTTAEKLRDYILNLHDFPGASGIYDFRTNDQHGLDDNAVIFVKWDPKSQDFVNASRFGGVAL